MKGNDLTASKQHITVEGPITTAQGDGRWIARLAGAKLKPSCGYDEATREMAIAQLRDLYPDLPNDVAVITQHRGHKMKSQRSDGLGHWPAGKRRNPDRGSWSRVRLALSRFLDAHHCRGQISARRLASDLGVSPRTVNRWLHGVDRPAADAQDAAQQWLAEWREQLQAEQRTRA